MSLQTWALRKFGGGAAKQFQELLSGIATKCYELGYLDCVEGRESHPESAVKLIGIGVQKGAEKVVTGREPVLKEEDLNT